jgi:hypothetical protein
LLYLKRRVAAEVEQRLDDADVALVDGDVEGSLPSLVPDVDVTKPFFRSLTKRPNKLDRLSLANLS